MHFVRKVIKISDSSRCLPLSGALLAQIASVVLAAAFERFAGFTYDGKVITGSLTCGTYDDSCGGTARARCDFRLSTCTCTSASASASASAQLAEDAQLAENARLAEDADNISILCEYTRPDVYYSQVWPRIAHCLRAARLLVVQGKVTTATQTDESGEPGPAAGEPTETDLETLARFQAAGRALAAPEAAAGAHLAAVGELRECLARPDDARRYGATAVLYLRELCGHRDGAVRRAALDVLWGL